MSKYDDAMQAYQERQREKEFNKEMNVKADIDLEKVSTANDNVDIPPHYLMGGRLLLKRDEPKSSAIIVARTQLDMRKTTIGVIMSMDTAAAFGNEYVQRVGPVVYKPKVGDKVMFCSGQANILNEYPGYMVINDQDVQMVFPQEDN